MRVGFGYDSHRFQDTVVLPAVQKLGGVEFSDCPTLVGHSDADVVIHAVIDALLGAAALGDIGSHFPDSDPKWKGADSAGLLGTVVEEIGAAGYAVGNVDVTVVCERPKIRPHAEAMRSRLAGLLRIPVGSVSLKGKTNEGMDATGEGRGIAVYAVAMIESVKG